MPAAPLLYFPFKPPMDNTLKRTHPSQELIMKSDPTPLQLTKICLKQLGQVCLSTLFLLYNSTLLIYVINQRHTHTETTLSD